MGRSWKNVCMRIEKGGLGVRKLNILNNPIRDWTWRFAIEGEGATWKKCIK